MGEVRACLLMNRFEMLLLNTLIVVFFTTSTTARFHGITPCVYYYTHRECVCIVIHILPVCITIHTGSVCIVIHILYFLVPPNGPLSVLSHQMLF